MRYVTVTTPNRPLLDIQNVTACYAYGDPVLKDVSLQIFPGEVLGLIGESGCGKTTLIRCILRLLPHGARIMSGDILYEGNSLLSMREKEMRALRGHHISYIPQDCGGALNDSLHLRQTFAEILGTKDEQLFMSLLEKVHLPAERAFLDNYPFQLSGGMKQRVLMAIALGMSPRIIVADEPTSSVDAPNRREVLRALMELRENDDMAMLIITHNIADLAVTADRIAVMRLGQIIEEGETSKLLHEPKEEYTQALIAGATRKRKQGS